MCSHLPWRRRQQILPKSRHISIVLRGIPSHKTAAMKLSDLSRMSDSRMRKQIYKYRASNKTHLNARAKSSLRPCLSFNCYRQKLSVRMTHLPPLQHFNCQWRDTRSLSLTLGRQNTIQSTGGHRTGVQTFSSVVPLLCERAPIRAADEVLPGEHYGTSCALHPPWTEQAT